MSIEERILKMFLNIGTQTEVKLNKLYEDAVNEGWANGVAYATFRARVYELMEKGIVKSENKTYETVRENISFDNKIIRTGRGRYMLVGAEIEAIVEHDKAENVLPRIIDSRVKYDMVFLDIPYNLGGQKGGNRNLSDYNMIEPEEFQELLYQVEKTLKDENSQVYFMIAGGKSSIAKAQKYISCFDNTELKLAATGGYQKMKKDGVTPCNMGKHTMPKELIFVFSKDGKLKRGKENNTQLDFDLVRPALPKQGGYPTMKPEPLLDAIVRQSTNIGEWVLDLFSGSGVSLNSCLKLKRKIHAVDISVEAVNNFIMKKVDSFKDKIATITRPINNLFYNKAQEEALALFV